MGTRTFRDFVGLRNLFKDAFVHNISSDSIPKNLFLGVSVCFYQAAGEGQLSCSPGLDILSFFVFAFDVVHGSCYLCYPRSEKIWHYGLVGVMPDLAPCFSRILSGHTRIF